MVPRTLGTGNQAFVKSKEVHKDIGVMVTIVTQSLRPLWREEAFLVRSSIRVALDWGVGVSSF